MFKTRRFYIQGRNIKLSTYLTWKWFTKLL